MGKNNLANLKKAFDKFGDEMAIFHEQQMIYQRELKIDAAMANRLPPNAYWHLSCLEWEGVRKDYLERMEKEMNIEYPLDRFTKTHTDPDTYCADASDLGFPPGRWPRVITLGNDRLNLDITTEQESVYYDHTRRVKLIVFND